MSREMISIDVRIPGKQIKSEGIAYFRISPEFRDFILKCEADFGVIGFSYDFEDLNFGIVLKSSEPEFPVSEEQKKVEEELEKDMKEKEEEIKGKGKKEINAK